jgi:hypothetical protein
MRKSGEVSSSRRRVLHDRKIQGRTSIERPLPSINRALQGTEECEITPFGRSRAIIRPAATKRVSEDLAWPIFRPTGSKMYLQNLRTDGSRPT